MFHSRYNSVLYLMKVGSIQRDEMLNSDFSQILKEGEEKCLKLINRKGFIF